MPARCNAWSIGTGGARCDTPGAVRLPAGGAVGLPVLPVDDDALLELAAIAGRQRRRRLRRKPGLLPLLLLLLLHAGAQGAHRDGASGRGGRGAEAFLRRRRRGTAG